MRKNKWIVTAKRADFNQIAAECGISPILARLIRNRDVIGTDGTMRFLEGGLQDLHDPRLLPDADKAVEIMERKIREANRRLQNPEDDLPPVSLSVGVAFSDRQNPEGDIFKDADTALYRVKRQGRGNCGFY